MYTVIASSFYAILFTTWTLAIILLFGVSSLLFCLLFQKKGWTNITEKGPRWFQNMFIIGALVTGLVIGTIVGIQVGFAKTGLRLYEGFGKKIIEQGLDIAVKPLGVENLHEPIGIIEARLALVEIRNIEITELSGIQTNIVNNVLDNIRAQFVNRCEEIISRVPGDEVSLAEIATIAYNDLHNISKRTANIMIFSKIAIGYFGLLVLSMVALVFIWALKKLSRQMNKTVGNFR